MARPRLALVAPVRTPIGKFGGALAALSAVDLGTVAASACLERAGVEPGRVDQLIFGHARQAGGGPNSARQIGWRAGLPAERPAFTINQACGSGLQSILTAARSILLGEAEVVLAGGTESMSNTPYMLPRARWGYRLGDAEVTDGMYRDGFNDPLSGLVMGETAEELAAEKGVSRDEADAWALGSQRRCQAAREAGRFAPEIAPVFREGGTVTAGNASGITDGAAAVLVASESAVSELGLEPAAFLRDWEVVGVDPRIMGIGPVPATRALLERNAIAFDAVESIELNEAFASQVVACLRELPFDPARVNPDGGAIAIGHPIGCTGARIVTTLVHGMASRGERLGVATLCVSGGLGLAALIERP